MEIIGTVIIYIIMACAVIGAFAYIRDPESGLGKEFQEGLYSIGPIFVPVAGIMAAIPYLSQFVSAVVGPLFAMIGADPAIAATTIIAIDMGGYQLANVLAQSRESWIIATLVGYMAGATIIFSIPVGLSMLKKSDHPYMALGIMSGILSIPIGVFISALLIMLGDVQVRPEIAATGDATLSLALDIGSILRNLAPLAIFCVAIALGLRFAPNAMIKGFLWFGKIMYAGITLVLVFSIVEYFTGIFSTVLGGWGFDPIIADEADQFRALEIAGYIGIMLSGAFPMVYLVTKYLAGPMEAMGSAIGVSPRGAAGLLAAVANVLAMYRLIGDMPARDKVLAIAFCVCAAFSFGDHLAFAANFQPSIILPLLLGKLGGGICGFVIALWLSVPKAREIEAGQIAAVA
ncbi:ethanolamine utilization protein EutH [Pseudorhodobacter aquimaris]|uniref:ethanolamine utilization protein EutH n=1 Tax=Pseudorhodobacter aquimaris TaxID=687412 RepID=UPI00067D59CF|nr:ethanolamine utilization protein EutH [Pseudorhodobacter aquimaris]